MRDQELDGGLGHVRVLRSTAGLARTPHAERRGG